MSTVGGALTAAADRLDRAGCDAPRLDAELLLGRVLGATRAQLYLSADDALSPARDAAFGELVARREAREPLAYILGEWGFRGLDLAVDRRVLVPRPETEQLVDVCLQLAGAVPQPRILDVGTGSGAIALALATELAGSVVTGADVSADALEVAAANGRRAGAAVEWVESDLLARLAGRSFDLVVSNPPYVPSGDLAGLEPEVRDWEPALATTPGGDGLEVLSRLAAQAFGALASGGALAVECGHDQARAAAAEMAARGYAEVAVHRDLAGVERFVSGRRA